MSYQNGEYPVYQDYNPRRGGGMFSGTPWGALIVAAVVIGILVLALQENKTGTPSPTLDKVDECCKVLSGDK